MAYGPITLWQIDGETVEIVTDFIFGGSKITVACNLRLEIKKWLLLGRNVMINLDSLLKSRDITLPTSEVSQSYPTLCVSPWTVAHHTPPFMEFSRQEYWNGLPFSSPEDLPHPGLEPGFPALQAGALSSEPSGNSNKDLSIKSCSFFSSHV